MVWVYKDNGVGAVVTSGILGVPARAADPPSPDRAMASGSSTQPPPPGQTPPPLPNLAGLNCSKLSPEAKRQRAADGADDAGAEPSAAPSAAPRAEWTVTQAEAKA